MPSDSVHGPFRRNSTPRRALVRTFVRAVVHSRTTVHAFGFARALALAFALAGCHRGAGAGAHPVSIAAASDLRFALDELVADLRRRDPTLAVTVTYGSSGNFYAQLGDRAPFDLFLSADASYARQLAARGLASPEGAFTYAVGRVALVVPAGSPLDPARGADALLDPSVHHVAVANPQHAPYGRAAVAALHGLGVYDAVAPRLVYGDNVAQAAQFVESGAAEAGLVALSLALAPQARARYWVVPPERYPRIEQGGVILRWARDPAAARAVRDALTGPRGQEILSRHGLAPPA